MLHVHEFADVHLHAYAPFKEGLANLKDFATHGVGDICLLAYTYIETGIDNNIVCLYYREKADRVRVRAMGGLYYDRDLNDKIMPFKDQAELLLDLGFDGIKFMDMKPNYQLYAGYTCDDPVYDEMYDMLEKRGTPLIMHIADPESFWHKELLPQEVIDIGWCYDDPKFLTQQQIFDCTLRRMRKNPNLNMCLAHFGFLAHRPELATYFMENFPNFKLDLTPATNIFHEFGWDTDFWHDFFTKYADRILYGTDNGTYSNHENQLALQQLMIDCCSGEGEEYPLPYGCKEKGRGLNLSAEVQQKIMHDNYFAFLGKDRHPLNRSLYFEHAKTIRDIAVKQGDQAMVATLDEAMQL